MIILVALEGSISGKQAETMIALAISLTECQEALSERHLETNVWFLLCLELTFAHEAEGLILNIYFTDVFWDISFENEI